MEKEKFYKINIELAKMYGTNGGLVLTKFCELKERNKRELVNLREGDYWVVISLRGIQEELPHLTVMQIRRAIDKLLKAEVLVKGIYNENEFDRTSWYKVANSAMEIYEGKE